MAAVEAWEKAHPLDTTGHNVLFLSALAVFLFFPVLLFVAGPDYLRLGFRQMFSDEYWMSFRRVVMRAFCWFGGGGATMLILALWEQIFAI
jgi:hypothetical protein